MRYGRSRRTSRSSSPSDGGRGRAAFADAAVLGEADLVRVRRRLDELAQRLAALEARTGARLERRLRSVAPRTPGA